jgi:YD repeat-containing protein
VTNPLNHFIQMVYDDNGYLTRIKDLSGNWTDYTYDTKDRLTKIKDTYDAETKLSYDDLDRLKELNLSSLQSASCFSVSLGMNPSMSWTLHSPLLPCHSRTTFLSVPI